MNSHRTIGQFSKHLFWDVDRSKLNLENDKPYIIRQVLVYGLLEDWVLLQRCFGIGQIAKTAKSFRELDKKTLSFIAFLSKSQKKDFRCYTYQQLTPLHWNF